MDTQKKEGTLSRQCSINSESTGSNDILWLRTKYECDQIKIGESKSILVADENYLTETISFILEDSNLIVDAVQNGAQVLKKIINKHYDVVVMEDNLPGLNGYEMAQIIKNMSSDTKIILMTRDEYWDETLKGTTSDVDAVLLKPFAPEELLKVIKKSINQQKDNVEKIIKLPFA